MPELTLHGREVATVFDLLGKKENDITYSLGWALGQSSRLTKALLAEVFDDGPGQLAAVKLQEFEPGSGFTDIELESERLHLIVEAKRGWDLPGMPQLEKYAQRFTPTRRGAIAVVSECTPAFAKPRLPAKVDGVPIHHLRWQELAGLVESTATRAGNIEKRVLRDLHRYLRGLMTMQNTTSNMVYVVSLGTGDLFGSGLSFADIVVKHDRYFHPMGGGRGGWPRTPPNYLGFRFHGRLQQIRHVEDYDVRSRPWDDLPALKGKPDWGDEPHFAYELGPVIRPAQSVKTGSLYRNARVWAALDLLLTCDSISDARDRTKARLAEAGED